MLDERMFTRKLLESEQMLYRIACAFLRSEADRQDAMQESALKAWKNRDDLREERFFKTWITRIMVNECKQLLRKNKKTIIANNILDQQIQSHTELDVRLMLESLPEKQRVPLILHYLEGFSLQEISQVQKVSIGIVKYRMYQSRKALRVEWDGKEELK
jgi:RNA polymerase sigma-70 factor (ECF subfamily)